MVRGLGFRVEDLGLRAALEQSRQSRPDTGLGLQVRVDKTFEVVPSLPLKLFPLCSEAVRVKWHLFRLFPYSR